MQDEIHIPAAALEAGARAACIRAHQGCHADLDYLERYAKEPYWEDIASAAFNAIVKAWEGMFENPAGDYLMLRRNAIILPLTEKPDGE